MDAREEALGILSKIWQKLQALPHADPVELGAFFIILTFICECLIRALCQLTVVALSNANVSLPSSHPVVVLLMAVVPCVSCCCHRRRARTKATDL